jgi:prepilin-type N-terminal cleavage/methylation domain-containing protein
MRGRAARPLLRGRAAKRDDGVSLIEVLVAIAVVGIVMTAVASFFIRTVAATGQQRGKQIATHIADSAMERVRALKGSSVADGRQASDATPATPTPIVALPPATEWYNKPPATGGALLPVDPETVTVAGLNYQRYWYVGRCRMPVVVLLGGTDCSLTPPASTSVPMFRVVVAVTWKDKGCTGGNCKFVTSTLVSAEADEPVFNENETAPSPVIENPGNIDSDIGVAIDRTFTTTGGAPPVTVAGDNIPAGLTLSSNGRVAGTPTTKGTYAVVLRVTDIRGRVGTTSFTWSTYVVPKVTAPSNQTTAIGVPVNLQIVNTGPGEGTITWTAAGTLPTGITLNASTGLFTGTPTVAKAAVPITVRATDSRGKYAEAAFTWTIIADWYVSTVADKTSAKGTAITAQTFTAVGGQSPYTWTATGLPPGLTLAAATGQVTGTPTANGNPSVTVTARDARSQTKQTTFKWKVN